MHPSTDSRSGQQHGRGRGRGPRGTGPGHRGRGRGRGRGEIRSLDGQSHASLASVPAFRDVTPGVGVSIVLKVDQATGRQVQGIVNDVLTSGNHPRGVKVRLQDGRVGRVQQIVDVAVAQTASEGLSNLGRNGENGLGASPQKSFQPTATPSMRHYSDMREDGFDYDNEASSRAAPSLLDFVRQPKQRKKQKAAAVGPPTSQSTTVTEPALPLAVCPVCGLFEGDEMAVAHHANSHFDE